MYDQETNSATENASRGGVQPQSYGNTMKASAQYNMNVES